MIDRIDLEFDTKIEQKVFKEILDVLTFIEPVFVDRKEFNSMEWNFLVPLSEEEKEKYRQKTDKRWQHVFRKDYKLFLPKDLNKEEYPSIILRINKLTFWDKLPEYASTKELQIKILIAYKNLLSDYKKVKWTNTKQERQYKKALWKYYRVYKRFWFNVKDLKSEESVENIIEKYNKQNMSEYAKKRLKMNIKCQLKEFESEIKSNNGDYNKYLEDELSEHLLESFLERWVNNIRFGLKLMTKWEQALVEERQKEKNKWDIIILHQATDEMKEEEIKLRDEIKIDKYKKELEELRKSWHKRAIAQKELEASNAIIKAFYKNFPYQETKELYWSQPAKILQTKELFCVWYSIVWHAFLEELWIKHKWLWVPWHSALEVDIWWKKYLFDATKVWQLLEFKYWEKKNNIWVYRKMVPIWWNETNEKSWKKIETFFISWNVEKVLLSQILGNKWVVLYNLWRYKEAIKMYDEAIQLNPKNSDAYYNKWIALYNLWRYKEAIKMYDKVIELNPDYVETYYKKWVVLYNLWRYKEAIKMYDKVIELKSDYVEAYNYKWVVLYNLWRYKEAMKMYDKAIELNPYYVKAYYNKWIALYNLWKQKIWNLYIFVYDYTKWNVTIAEQEEKKEIKKFIDSKDYEWLRKYLLSLEKEN